MKKILLFALCLLLCLMPLCALAGTRLPAMRGVVTDDADVLGQQTASDIVEYADEVQDETDIRLHVALVHFLDGMDAQSYANALFDKWELGEYDLLLLGAAGEDAFATAMGDKVSQLLGEKNAENLLYTSSQFSTLFRSQQYDAAFASYFQAFNTLACRQTGENVKIKGLFGASEHSDTSTHKVHASQLWGEVMNAISDSSADYQEYHEQRTRTGNGLTAGGWIVLAILILIIFGQSDPVRKARHNRQGTYRSYGCGCSPLGWILSLFGLNVLIDTFRRRR